MKKAAQNFIEIIDALVQSRQYEAAKSECRKRLVSDPEDADGLYLLGTVHLIASEFEAGLEPLVRLAEKNPYHLNALINLGHCRLKLKQFSESAACFEKVLAKDPENMMALNNLGAICTEEGRHGEAAGYYQHALKILPGDPEIKSNLMLSCKAFGQKQEAVSLALQIAKIKDGGQALFPAFNILKSCCFWSEAAEIVPKLIQKIRRGEAGLSAFNHINLPLLSVSDLDYETLFEILNRSGEMIECGREAPSFEHNEQSIAPALPWRVGYLSPDFRNHAVDHFIRGLIEYHDRTQFEVICYSNTSDKDEITAQYQKTADRFVDVRRMTDRCLAERIHADGVHFLIDLAGFTAGGRLTTLSYRPAPLQMMYLGYPYTCGLKTVDFFISDAYADGPENAAYFSETLIHLPQSFVSFFPTETGGIVDEIPMIKNGFATFGSLINPYKLNAKVIRVWSETLKQLPKAKLFLNHPEYDLEMTRSNILRAFSQNSIDANRISFCWKKHVSGNFLQYYNEIDIVLDPFPATGGTTTIDALQMGKPVVTLVGKVNYERLSYSILKNVGIHLNDLIADNKTDYIEKAIELASNSERVATLRHDIPKALKKSILCDPLRFTRQMETLYFEAWKKKYDFIPVLARELSVKTSVSV